MTLFMWRRLRAVVAAILIVGSAATADAQTGSAFTATLSPPSPNPGTGTFTAVLTLTNLGPTLYSPLTVTILRTPPGNPGNTSAAVSLTSVVALPNGSLLPNETQKATIIFAPPVKAGFTNTVTSVAGSAAPAGLGLTVTMPTAGQTPSSPSFLVTGTLSAPRTAGVSLDGIPACLVGSMFFVNAFEPRGSPSTFTAVATDIDGGQKSLPVNISPSAKGLQVTTLPACGGVVPLTALVNVSLTTSDGDSISSETIDFGAGAGPSSVTPGAQARYVYSSPGLYTVTARATTMQGASLAQRALVSVLTPAQAFAPILTNVSLLQSALTSQNVPRAVSYHTYTSQLRYLPLLTQAGINLRALGTLMSTAQPVVLVGDYAEVVVTTPGTNPQQSSVVLVRDNFGIWRVDSW